MGEPSLTRPRLDVSIYRELSLQNINQIYGETFEPRIEGDLVLLQYPGIKFLFKYFADQPITQSLLNSLPNKLLKITIFSEDLSPQVDIGNLQVPSNLQPL
jgi:hypothetical protein